jgi:hypothetical protein
METAFRNYIYKSIVLTTVILITAYGIFTNTGLKIYYLQIFPFMLLLLFLINMLVHFILVRASMKKPEKFSVHFMAAFGIKLFLYIIFIGIYLLLRKQNAVPFLITFFILYLFYTILEVFEMLSFLKKTSKK